MISLNIIHLTSEKEKLKAHVWQYPSHFAHAGDAGGGFLQATIKNKITKYIYPFPFTHLTSKGSKTKRLRELLYIEVQDSVPNNAKVRFARVPKGRRSSLMSLPDKH